MTEYYVDGAVGNDANAGTAEGAGNAWASMSHAATVVAAGDIVNVKASVTYTEQVTITTVGTSTSFIVWRGYTTTPGAHGVGDEGMVTIDAESTRAYCFYTAGTTLTYNRIENFICKNATSHGIAFANADNCSFRNIEVDNCGGHGLTCDNQCKALNVAVTNSGNYGINIDTGAWMVGCIMGNSVNRGCDYLGGTLVYKNLSYGTSGTNPVGMYISSGSVAIKNTVDCEGIAGSIGIDVPSNALPFVIDNVIHDAVDACIRHQNSTSADHYATIANNLFSGGLYTYKVKQGTAESNGYDQYNNKEQDAVFTDEAGDDYTQDAASPGASGGLLPGSYS